jgi:hypothetical protein
MAFPKPHDSGGVGVRVRRNDTFGSYWWGLGWLGLVFIVAIGLLLLLLGPLHLAAGGTDRLAAVLAFVGVLVTATVSVVGLTLTRQSSANQNRRLRLDAAMRAGESFSSPISMPVDPASIASSLLALTKLDNPDLAVALLVNFWSPRDQKITTETAVLVVDAALRCRKLNAQLIAAELLCRNSPHLDPCQSLHWPSYIDGCWDHTFGPKTKLLLVDALTLMTLAKKPANEGALRSVAVRLYGIFAGDRDKRFKGCVATLIKSLIPSLRSLGYSDFMQGNQQVTLGALEKAAESAKANDDDYLARMVRNRSNELRDWAQTCPKDILESGPGALATAWTDRSAGQAQRLPR